MRLAVSDSADTEAALCCISQQYKYKNRNVKASKAGHNKAEQIGINESQAKHQVGQNQLFHA